MDKVELVRKAYTFGKPEESMAYFSDDFKATDETGGPALDKASWFGMGELMRAAIPDIYYVFEVLALVKNGITGNFLQPPQVE